MNETHKIKLISKTYAPDAIGQQIETETERSVFAWIHSAYANEAEEAEDGFKREFVFDVRIKSYNMEDELEYQGVRYSIYRPFRNTSKGVWELHTQRRVGS
jgi:SPP1 family predicted phage head-tail adaptor